MTDETEQRYPTLREHLDLRERVTVVEGESRDVKESLRRIENMLSAARPPGAQDASALALHNLADAMRQQLQKPSVGEEVARALAHHAASRPQSGGGVSQLLSHIGVLAIGAVAAWAFLGFY